MESIDYYLQHCDQVTVNEQALVIRANSELVINALRRCWKSVLEVAQAEKRDTAFLYLGNGEKPHYKIYDWFLQMEENQRQEINPDLPTPTGLDLIAPYLKNADEIRVLEFMKEKISEGLIVIITSQIDNRCRFTSKSLKPERAFWTPEQFVNYDYLKSWDIDRIGRPSQEYERMRELLDRDAFIPGYKYRLRRPDPDGSLCEYSTDYYHVADGWGGEPIRIGVSHPNDWRLLELATN
jgi:hypothetical protein